MLAKTHHTQMPLNKREEQHNMVQFGTDLQKSSDTAPSAQAGNLSIGCPGGFWKSPRRRLHSLSGHVVPMLSHPHSTEVLPGIQKALPVFLTLGTTEKSMSPYSVLSLQVSIDIDKIPPDPSFLHAEQSRHCLPFLIKEILQSLKHLSN